MTDNEKPTGRRKSALARKDSLTQEQRTSIAQRAAAARWGTPLKATHKGNFKQEFGFDVECYVLDDAQKSAVISKRGLGAALGFSEGGNRISAFLRGAKIAPYAGRELIEKLENPLIFQLPPLGAKAQPPTPIHGHDVTILIDICKAIITAEDAGLITDRQKHIAKQAHIVLNASAKAGIKGLVYALSGYNPTANEVIQAFKLFVQEEAREYEREFPPQLYSEWYRLYQLPKPERGRPWKAKSLTVDHVYYPLARSSGKILNLTRQHRESSNTQHRKLHQFLSEVGVKALRTHLGQILGIARISSTKEEYEQHVKTLFGDQLDLFAGK